jgi:hypothetical protein
VSRKLSGRLTSFLRSHAAATEPAERAREPLNVGAEEFLLELSGDWVAHPSDQPEQWRFVSRRKHSSIVISVIHLRSPKERLGEVAEKLAEVRLSAELQLRSGRDVHFGDSWVELMDDGEVGYVAYAGYDDETIFRFMGWVTRAKVLSLNVETHTRDNALSKGIFDEVFSGLRLYLP